MRIVRTRRKPFRDGLTLLEVLLCLAVLVTFFAIAWPNVIGRIRDQKLQGATEDVRKHFAGTRVQALNAGVTYQFRFEPNGRYYVVLPQEFLTSLSEEPAEIPYQYAGQLPEAYHFQADADWLSLTETLPQQSFASLTDAAELSGVAWSPPIWFHPSGSADDAEFWVVDEDDRLQRIMLRGLTSRVSVSSITSLKKVTEQ